MTASENSNYLEVTEADKHSLFVAGNIDQSLKKNYLKRSEIQVVMNANSFAGIVSLQTGLDNWDIPT